MDRLRDNAGRGSALSAALGITTVRDTANLSSETAVSSSGEQTKVLAARTIPLRSASRSAGIFRKLRIFADGEDAVCAASDFTRCSRSSMSKKIGDPLAGGGS